VSSLAAETERKRRLRELADAGWHRLAGTADDTTAWSSWEVPKPGNWHGFLLVLSPIPGWRSLSLRAETVGSRPAGGWPSSISATR
jgi:hypothetical protein